MTMSDSAIEIDKVDKIYKLYPSLSDRLWDTLGIHKNKKELKEFNALENINLTIKKGERIGLIGRNGAGKTTLLKLLIGHIKPTNGSIRVNGSVQAMIHSNLGTHMHFTGYENIISALTYNNLTPSQMQDAIADIEDFTELGDYLKQPIKNYSLGMRSRLQFAIASAVNPDILIVDEMLGSGDTYFMRKSSRRMQGLIDTGCTLLLVSHNTQQILQFCERGVWLRSGQLYYDDAVRNVVNSYDVYIERETDKRHAGTQLSEKTDERTEQTDDPKQEFQTTLADGKKVYRMPSRKGLCVQSVSLLSESIEKNVFQSGDEVDIEFKILVEKNEQFACRYMFTVWSLDGRRIARIENHEDAFSGEEGQIRNVRVRLSPLLLGEGDYTLNLSIYDTKDYDSTSYGQDVRLDILTNIVDFKVTSKNLVKPRIYLNSKWS